MAMTIREIADALIAASDERVRAHHLWAERVAEWEVVHGKYDFRKGGRDYWDEDRIQEAYRRYVAVHPDDQDPLRM